MRRLPVLASASGGLEQPFGCFFLTFVGVAVGWLGRAGETRELPLCEVSPGSSSLSPDLFDRAYVDLAVDNGGVAALFGSVMGDEYPAELAPNSLVTWSVLYEALETVDLSSGSVLVDLACGTGGLGLWLARESGADLIGVDWSPEAVRQATERTSSFALGGRASFRVGLLTDTGLDDGVADAVVCFDSFQFASDPGRCAEEIARVLRRGGRFVMTGWTCFHGNGDEPVDVEAVLGGGGLVLDSYVIREDLRALERAVFEAAAAVGPGESRALDMLREEAREVLSDLDEFDRIMVTATKP
jgi:ubiquinone/menaquinone biosynthesis C-methylase UbiE